MANPVKGEVPLQLDDGRDFTLVFDMDALIQAEDEYGKPLPVLMERVRAGFVGAVRILFWAALQRHHPEVTLSDVNDLLTEHSDAIEKMLTAYQKAMPAEGKEGKNPPAKTRRGKTSGSSGAKRG